MTLRAINEKYLEPAAQTLMILGIIALCQPWSLFLHQYGLTVTLIGLVGFSITSKFAREDKSDESEPS